MWRVSSLSSLKNIQATLHVMASLCDKPLHSLYFSHSANYQFISMDCLEASRWDLWDLGKLNLAKCSSYIMSTWELLCNWKSYFISKHIQMTFQRKFCRTSPYISDPITPLCRCQVIHRHELIAGKRTDIGKIDCPSLNIWTSLCSGVIWCHLREQKIILLMWFGKVNILSNPVWGALA